MRGSHAAERVRCDAATTLGPPRSPCILVGRCLLRCGLPLLREQISGIDRMIIRWKQRTGNDTKVKLPSQEYNSVTLSSIILWRLSSIILPVYNWLRIQPTGPTGESICDFDGHVRVFSRDSQHIVHENVLGGCVSPLNQLNRY